MENTSHGMCKRMVCYRYLNNSDEWTNRKGKGWEQKSMGVQGVLP